MYHYVRDLTNSRYPRIKGLNIAQFEGQLDYLEANYRLLDRETFLDIAIGQQEAGPKDAFLSFDDGYLEHFTTVYPALKRRGLAGGFFPCVSSVRERRLLDVNKIHFVLASHELHDPLVDAVLEWIATHQAQFRLEEPQSYFDRFAKPSRYDPAGTVFIKRVLQKGLPAAACTEVVNWLFETFCDDSEAILASELYMTTDQLRTMHSDGMLIGGHGHDHLWFDTLDRAGKTREIESSMALLEEIGQSPQNWVMCYPYGAWDEETIELLKTRNCTVGLTTRMAVADPPRDDAMKLPRLDTTVLPFCLP